MEQRAVSRTIGRAAAQAASLVDDYARWLCAAQPGAIAPPPACFGAGSTMAAQTALSVSLLMREAEAAGLVAITPIVAPEGVPAGIYNYRATRTGAAVSRAWDPAGQAAASVTAARALAAAAIDAPALRRAA